MSKSPYSITDYVAKFQYKQLTPIVEEPNLQAVLQLGKEVKQNTQCIFTTLGGRQLGYFLEEDTSNKIPDTAPFIHLSNPGTFKIQDATAVSQTNITARTQLTIDITNQKAKHEHHEEFYWETQALNKPFEIR